MTITKKKKKALFEFKPFSKKQLKVLTWWMPNSPYSDMDGLIASGSIRAGKTLAMSLSFVFFAMENFVEETFLFTSKSVGAFRRNIWFFLRLMLKSRGYTTKEVRNDNLIIISKGEVTNYFYYSGGLDQSSYQNIQGMTLAGLFMDEVALQPESFVNQAISRCSIEGSKFFFNCNPAGPEHFFKKEFIDKCDEKNLLFLHFTMDDNLSLSEHIKNRYKSMYEKGSVFYRRYIEGEWCMAEGLIYTMFDRDKHIVDVNSLLNNNKITFNSNIYVSCDYGTQNACVFQLWRQDASTSNWYMTKEYCYSGRDTNIQKTDAEYVKDMKDFIGDLKVKRIIVDPSASSFIAALKKENFSIKKANNSVNDGIREVSSMLVNDKLYFDKSCTNMIKEFGLYAWDEKKGEKGQDVPMKVSDHSCDACRYFVHTVIAKGNAIQFLK